MYKFFSTIFITLAIASAVPVSLFAASVNGTSHDNLAEALGAVLNDGAGDYVITLESDQTIAPFTLHDGVHITLETGGESSRVSLSANGAMFTVGAGATLTLSDGVTLAGRNNNITSLVLVEGGGVFNMDGGAITGNSVNASFAGGAGRGGAVGVDSSGAGGVFNMNGGEIFGNAITGTGGTIGGSGGVFLYGHGAVFNLSGGAIRNNTDAVVNTSGNGAGGVFVSNGTFNMSGGEIVNNSQTGTLARAGGGVYLAYSSQFHMSGGTIANNSAMSSSSGSGDGVFIIGTASIYLSGSPAINDGVYTSGNFSTSVRVDGAIDEHAHIVVEGSGAANQMNAATNLTAAFPDGVEAADVYARAFVSKDNTLIGKIGGTTANPRVVWAYNYEVGLEPDTIIIDTAIYDYDDVSALAFSVTVRNLALETGELNITLAGDNADDFELSTETLASIALGGSATFTVTPKLDLDVRTRSAEIIVTGDHGIFASVPLSFTIQPKPITVDASDIFYDGKIYDGTTDATGPAVIVLSTSSGVSARDEGNIVAAYESAVYDNMHAGLRNVTFSGLALRGAAAVNYRLTSDEVVKENVLIDLRDLVVKANDRLVTQGITCHELAGLESQLDAYTLVGLVGADTDSSVKADERTGVIVELFIEDGELEDFCYVRDDAPVPPESGAYPIAIWGATFQDYRYNDIFIPGVLTVSGKEDISDSIRIDFFVDTIRVVDSVFVYDGKSHEPIFWYGADLSTLSETNFKVHFVGTLAGGGHYDSDTPPTEAGSYFAEAIYEDDDYIGSKSVAFTIAPRPLTISRIQHTKFFDGSRNALGTDVAFIDDDNDMMNRDGVSVAYVSAIYTDENAGTTSLVLLNINLQGDMSSNYTIELPDTFTVAGITPKPITPEMFTIARQTFTGAELTPMVAGVDGSNVVSFDAGPYTNNKYAGTATVLVVGTGNYIGTLTLEFPINPKPITPQMFRVNSQVHTGDSIKPLPSASDGNNVVTFNIIDYDNNVNAGTGYIYIEGTDNYTGALTLTFSIYDDDDDICERNNCHQQQPQQRYAGSGSVTIADWTFDDSLAPNTPEVFSSTNRGRHTIEYKLRDADDSTYIAWSTITDSTNAGYYTIRVTFESYGEYDEYVATADFRIMRANQNYPNIPGLREYFDNWDSLSVIGTPKEIHTVAPDVPRIPMVWSGLGFAVSDSAFFIAVDTVNLDMQNWEYCMNNGKNYMLEPTFEVLPNNEYVILVRKRETENYFASLPVALLVRTAIGGDVGYTPQQTTPPANNNTQNSDTRKSLAGNINLASNVVSSHVRFNVEVDDAATINVAIYNHLGSVMYRRSNVRNGEEIIWNAGAAGVPSGTYLIVASARGANGKSLTLKESVGVTRR